jgi:hypothetical protein
MLIQWYRFVVLTDTSRIPYIVRHNRMHTIQRATKRLGVRFTECIQPSSHPGYFQIGCGGGGGRHVPGRPTLLLLETAQDRKMQFRK